ncbi:hypothetical protein SLS62_010233 [Diatrype stigma]|uniref:Ribosome assembly protein 3 n=1 Tax=Diatrype stigma TaxID=117547 RepID=A0AAN9UA69_9PEZI
MASSKAKGEKPSKTSASTSASAPAADFTSYYLQRATREFAEDLDKVRGADDFKAAADALPMLVRSLQQGTSMFSAADQRRILDARRSSEGAAAGGDGKASEGDESEEESS